MIGPRRWSDVQYLHLSSYFLVLRRPVLDDPGFRFRLDTVCGQRTKQLVVDKYEIGISRYLMDSGYHFETWADALYPFHPLYSRRTFDHVAGRLPAGQAQLPRPRTPATCPASPPGRSG